MVSCWLDLYRCVRLSGEHIEHKLQQYPISLFSLQSMYVVFSVAQTLATTNVSFIVVRVLFYSSKPFHH